MTSREIAEKIATAHSRREPQETLQWFEYRRNALADAIQEAILNQLNTHAQWCDQKAASARDRGILANLHQRLSQDGVTKAFREAAEHLRGEPSRN